MASAESRSRKDFEVNPMKRWISFVLALVLVFSLTACGGGKDPAPVEPEKPEVEQPDRPEQPGKSEQPDQTEPEAPPAGEEQAKLLPLQIMKGEDWLSEWDDNYNDLCTAAWDALALGEADKQTYPQLAARLENMNAAQYEDAAVFMQEWLPYAKEAMAQSPEYFGGFTNTVKYTVQRADSRILSVREDWSSYTGGVHPNSGTFGLNFDPGTGEELTLADVLTDVEPVHAMLAERLREKYPDVGFDNLDELLGYYQPENFHWTLGYQGITFYFSPYDIAPYAAGLLTATFWFDETPELFRQEYTAVPESGYAMALPEWHTVEADFSAGDGRRDTLSVVAVEGEYGSMQLVLALNGAEYREEGWSAFYMTPYLVCAGEQCYLYVEGRGENDYRTLYIYALQGERPELVSDFSGAGFMGHWDETAGPSGVYYYDVLTNPEHFELGSICQLLGTKTAVRTYSVSTEDGSLIPLSEEYGFAGQPEPIISSVPLDVTILPENRTETLPAGTEFSFLRTDNVSYVVMELTDGRECRIDIVEIDWTPTVNGVPEWECFENLMYAG